MHDVGTTIIICLIKDFFFDCLEQVLGFDVKNWAKIEIRVTYTKLFVLSFLN